MEHKEGIIHKLWTIVYAFFYPVIIVFSAVFLLLTRILSYPSRIIRRLLNKINLPNQE